MLTFMFLTVEMQLDFVGLVPRQLISVVTTNLLFSTFRNGGFQKICRVRKLSPIYNMTLLWFNSADRSHHIYLANQVGSGELCLKSLIIWPH